MGFGFPEKGDSGWVWRSLVFLPLRCTRMIIMGKQKHLIKIRKPIFLNLIWVLIIKYYVVIKEIQFMLKLFQNWTVLISIWTFSIYDDQMKCHLRGIILVVLKIGCSPESESIDKYCYTLKIDTKCRHTTLTKKGIKIGVVITNTHHLFPAIYIYRERISFFLKKNA